MTALSEWGGHSRMATAMIARVNTGRTRVHARLFATGPCKSTIDGAVGGAGEAVGMATGG
jgi:hypothetical protein